ncbi:DUF6493 family protein [Blastococcus sp. SYSU DS0617]
MADATVDAVLELLGAPDRLDELVTALAGLDEGGRRKVSIRVRSLAERIRWNDDSRAVSLAALGCVTGLRQVAAALDDARLPPDIAPLAVQVLTDRQPAWLGDLPAALLVQREMRAEHFPLVRALVREGAVARPDFPDYLESMVWGLALDLPSSTVLDQLRSDPRLLDDELWDLLATERIGRRMADHDRYHLQPQHWGDGPPPPPRPESTWQHALTALVVDGTVDRGRLIDIALGAFFRDWAAVDVTWFVGLHGALAPTEQELVDRQATYSRLLASEHGPVVKLGLTTLRTLLAGGHLDVDLLLASAPAALARADKGTVSATLSLLSDVAANRPDAAAQIAELVATAVQHERVDVQERAIALLTTLVPDLDQRQQLLEPYTAGLAPSLRPPSAAPVRVEEPPEPILSEPDPAVVPVHDADELGELFARLIEEADDPAEIERLLEGVLRLARERPRNGGEVLARRAEELLAGYFPGAWSGEEPRADLAALALVWLRGASPGRGFLGRDYGWESSFQTVRRLVAPPRLGRGSSLSELLTRRTHEVAGAVHAGGGTSLSLPTTRRGSLAAAELMRRIDALNPRAGVLLIDACVALLRVPPEEHDELRFSSSRAGRFLREQLRALRERCPDWQLVADRGERGQRDPRHAARPSRVAWRGVDAGHRGLDGALLAVLDRTDPLSTFGPEAADGECAARFDQVTAQWPLLLAHDPDLLAAHAHPRLYRGLIQNRSGSEPLLESLGRSTRPIGPPTLSVLLLGLSAKNGSERARAVDALIDLARRSMLDGAGLGRVLTQLLVAEAVIGSRVAQAMTDAARAEPRAGDALLQCLVSAVAALEGRRDAHMFVDLLAQLATERGQEVRLPEVFEVAAAGSSRSQLAQACRRVPRPR